MVTEPTDSGATLITATISFRLTPCLTNRTPLDSGDCLSRERTIVSDQKSTPANAVSTDRWESLKREYFMRTHRNAPIGSLPGASTAARVADPNAE